MDWINGMQRAIDYIEKHLLEEMDYEAIAAQSYSSSFHFQRMFHILCGYTLGEYIRFRRLSLAGADLAGGRGKVIDAALKYGYDSPDSFAKAFLKFHGVTPSQARMDGATLRSFSRLTIKISLEGGIGMKYRLEEKPAMVLTGYKRHFQGTPAARFAQEEDFYVSTRANQYILKGMSQDLETSYNVMTHFGDDGYDFYIASLLSPWATENLEKELGAEDAKRFETIHIPAGLYMVCETERTQYPTLLYEELRRQAVSQWLPSSGYELTNAPEISVHHWFHKKVNEAASLARYIELWLPVRKKE